MEVFTLKNYLFITLALVLLLSFSACSEDDNNTSPALLGYSLDQFVSQEAVREITDIEADAEEDFRDLYAYQILADDGWSARNSSNAGYDLDWNTFKSGYLVPADQGRPWFNDTDIPGAFSVKNAHDIKLYRQVKLSHDDLPVNSYVELRALPTQTIPNWDGADEAAVKLSDMVIGLTGYSEVTLTAGDGYFKTYSPEQIADGYYLLDSEVTTFPSFNDEMSGGEKKFKILASVTVSGGTVSDHEGWGNADEALTDLTIEFPEHFDSYAGTEMTE